MSWLVSGLIAFVILYPLGWFFFRSGGWLSNEPKNSDHGPR